MMNIEKFSQKFFADKSYENAALITSGTNRFYLSGFSSSEGVVFVTKDSNYLLVDFRYYEMAKLKVKDAFEIILCDCAFSEKIKELILKHSVSNVWIEDSKITVAELARYQKIFDGISFMHLKNTLEDLRSVKSDEEIEFIKSAQKITDDAFSHILNFISKDKTEKEVALELEYYMRLNGADGIAFDTICVSGAKSSLPHGVPSDVRLTQNSFITMDFGAKFNGYCADMTRTVVLGKADEKMTQVYSTVLEAQRRALEKIRSGVLGEVVDSSARDYIYKCGYEGCFGHSTGHGLGIEVHEEPRFSPKYKKQISENAVLSVEPGIYLEGEYGVRIEDIVVVKHDGVENLTKSEKNLIEI